MGNPQPLETERQTEPVRATRSGLPPEPRMSRLRQTMAWYRNPSEFTRSLEARLGRRFTVRLSAPYQLCVFTTDPEDVKKLHTLHPDDFEVVQGSSIFEPLVGLESILLSDGASHSRKRKLLMPAFHGERMRGYGAAMLEVTDVAINNWKVSERAKLHPQFQQIALEVIIRVVFGVAAGPQVTRMRNIIERMLNAGVAGILIPALRINLGRFSPWGKFLHLKKELDAMLFELISECRADQNRAERADVLSMLVSATDESGQGLSDRELRDELVTLLFAGHETTATLLAWAFHHALRGPDVLARLQSEVRMVTGGGSLLPEHVEHLKYTAATIEEALRLDTVVPVHLRQLKRSLVLGDYEIPAGMMVCPVPGFMQRSPAYWEEPELFRPARFLEKKGDPYTHFPFGGGVRRCIGMAFARYEATLVLARVVQRVQMTPLAPDAKPARRGVTLMPKGGVPVRFDAIAR